MLGILAVCTIALGPLAMFNLYFMPYWINVVWLDIVTYLHHHGPENEAEKVPWYRGEVCLPVSTERLHALASVMSACASHDPDLRAPHKAITAATYRTPLMYRVHSFGHYMMGSSITKAPCCTICAAITCWRLNCVISGQKVRTDADD